MTDHLLKKATQLVEDLTDTEVQRDAAKDELAKLRLDIEDILDAALGPDEWDGTGQGIVADVALLAQQRNTLLWLHAEALHNLAEAQTEISDLRDRARRVKENDYFGYIQTRNDLIAALGQHADPDAITIQHLVDRDVTALRESYDTIEAELIEWRTGQRAVEASVMQWGEVTSKLDEALTALRQLDGRLDKDAHVSGQLPTDEPSAGLRATGTDLDDGTKTVVSTDSLRAPEEATPDGR